MVGGLASQIASQPIEGAAESSALRAASPGFRSTRMTLPGKPARAINLAFGGQTTVMSILQILRFLLAAGYRDVVPEHPRHSHSPAISHVAIPDAADAMGRALSPPGPVQDPCDDHCFSLARISLAILRSPSCAYDTETSLPGDNPSSETA